MAGKVLNISEFLSEDQRGCYIAKQWVEWNTLRQPELDRWAEIREYLYATDTRQTRNAKLPWKNTTTIPKLCQINDNLQANYMASLFPRRDWFQWEAENKDANAKAKRDNILIYMKWATSQPHFLPEMAKGVADYVQTGNVIMTVEWKDLSQTLPDGQTKVGYVGPAPRRIDPLDIVFNPVATNFTETPKIIRSVTSMGELKKIIESESTDEDKQAYIDLFAYLKKIRQNAKQMSAEDDFYKDNAYQVDGFTSFKSYLMSDYVEILTFYGDMYDYETDTLLENHKIMVVDRHKVISQKPNPSYFGFAPIFHAGWRVRQNNLWGMSPLANLVGMQYKIDHLENLKADVLDLIAYPMVKIKGDVRPFEFGPLEHVYIGDDSDVSFEMPPYQVLQLEQEIAYYMNLMEELSGTPREAMGIRSPGEKTAYEVQKLDNASSRIFNNKILQFENNPVESTLNAMLEMGRRNMTGAQDVYVFDNDFDVQLFQSLTAADITGAGKIKPVAAKHFAEMAETVQNLTSFANSPIGQDPAVNVHMSGMGLAKLFEDLLGIKQYGIVSPFVRLGEQAEGMKLSNAYQEQIHMEGQQPSNLTPDDARDDTSALQGATAQNAPQTQGPVNG